MINVADPIIEKFVDKVHKLIERKNRKIAMIPNNNYLFENRVLKLFCENKTITLRQCSSEITARYKINMDDKTIIQILKANHLINREKRDELIEWAAETIAALAKTLESRKLKDFNDYSALCNKEIQKIDGERYPLQERLVGLMLYAKHPELAIGNDAETVENFGNIYMKYLLYGVTNFLKGICDTFDKPITCSEMSLKTFLRVLYVQYPELVYGADEITLEKFANITLGQVIKESSGILYEICLADTKIEKAQSRMTIEEFLETDPDAKSLLIAPSSQSI